MNSPGYDDAVITKVVTPEYKSGQVGDALSLSVRDLSCSRNDETLFRRVGFTVQPGQLLQIEGENGSGKTTLLKSLCGFIEPDEGEVLWQGINIKSAMDDYLAALHYVGHGNGIKLGLSCMENLVLASVLAASVQTDDLAGVLVQYGLGAYEDTYAQLLSSGQRRRLALARLSVCSAYIWILDEPFTSLDEKGKRFMQGIFSRHLDSGGMIVMTSHEDINWDGITVTGISL